MTVAGWMWCYEGYDPDEAALCGQRPSDDPDFARLLVRAGIDSISVAPDSFLAVKDNVAAERG